MAPHSITSPHSVVTPHCHPHGPTTAPQVKGMEELNGVQVRVLSVNIKHNTFELDVDSRAFRPYASGGLVTQVKQPKTLSFRPLADALRRPGEFLLLDFAKFDRSPQLHVGFAALDRFRASHGRLPAPWDDADAAELVRLAGEVNDTMGDAKVDRVDEDVLQKLAFTASGYLNPLAAMFGGRRGAGGHQGVLRQVPPHHAVALLRLRRGAGERHGDQQAWDVHCMQAMVASG